MAMINCPECGRQISDKALSCPGCGYDMIAPRCVECGEVISDLAAVCPKCGCPVENVKIETSEQVRVIDPIKAKNKLIPIIVAAIVLVAVIAVLIVVFKPQVEKITIDGKTYSVYDGVKTFKAAMGDDFYVEDVDPESDDYILGYISSDNSQYQVRIYTTPILSEYNAYKKGKIKIFNGLSEVSSKDEVLAKLNKGDFVYTSDGSDKSGRVFAKIYVNGKEIDYSGISADEFGELLQVSTEFLKSSKDKALIYMWEFWDDGDMEFAWCTIQPK